MSLIRPVPLNPQAPARRLSLVEWVGSGAPVGEEHAEANSLEDLGDNTDGDEVKRSLLGNDLSDELDEVSRRSV